MCACINLSASLLFSLCFAFRVLRFLFLRALSLTLSLSARFVVNRRRIFNPDIVVRMRTIYACIHIYTLYICINIRLPRVDECHIVFNLCISFPFSIPFSVSRPLALLLFHSAYTPCIHIWIPYVRECVRVNVWMWFFLVIYFHHFLPPYISLPFWIQYIAKSPKYSVYTKTLCTSNIEHAKTDFFTLVVFRSLNSQPHTRKKKRTTYTHTESGKNNNTLV